MEMIFKQTEPGPFPAAMQNRIEESLTLLGYDDFSKIQPYLNPNHNVWGANSPKKAKCLIMGDFKDILEDDTIALDEVKMVTEN